MSVPDRVNKKRKRRERLGAFQDHLCFFCDLPMKYLDYSKKYEDFDGQDADMASYDHYVPHSQGGAGSAQNQVIAHRGCNTRFGVQTKGHHYDEKLRLLNIKRGFGDSDGVVDDKIIKEQLRPDSIGKPTAALIRLCEIANELPGKEGMAIRRKARRRLVEHRKLMTGLLDIPNKALRMEALYAIIKAREAGRPETLPKPISTYVHNVIATMNKDYFNDKL